MKCNNSERWPLRFPLLVGLVAIALYGQTVGFEFCFDDLGIVVENTAVVQADWFGMLSNSYWSDGTNGLYRPLTTLSYGLNYALSGGEAGSFHLVNVALHAVNALVLCALIRLHAGREPAGYAGALFLCNPLLVEAVAGIVGRAELLAFALGAGGWLVWDRGQKKGRISPARWGMTWLLLLASIMAKESGLLFALLLFIGSEDRRRLAAWCGVSAVGVGTLIKYLVIGRVSPSAIGFIDNPLAYVSLAERILNGILIAGRYLLKLVVPWPLSPDYSYSQLTLYKNGWEGWLLAGGVLCLLAGLAWIVLKFNSIGRWGWYILAAVFLVSSIPTASSTIFAERLLYAPAAGLAVAIALALDKLNRRVRLIAFCALSAMFMALLIRQIPVWKSDEHLFRHAVQISAESARTHYGWALTQHRKGRHVDAEEAYGKALEIYPNYADARYNLGALYIATGQYEKALACYQEVVKRNPNHAKSRRALALLEIENGHAQWGIAQLERLIADQPQYVDAYESLARALIEEGQWRRAGRIVDDGLRLQPGHEGLQQLRALIGGRG